MKLFKKINTLSRRVIVTFFDMHLAGGAAELSYYFLFSVFPLIMATSAVTFIKEDRDGMLSRIFERFFPEVVSELFADFYSYIMRFNNRAFLAVGILLSIYAFSRYMNSLKRSIREIFGVKKGRGFVIEWVTSAVFATAVIFGLYLTFFIQTLGSGILTFMSEKVFDIPESLIRLWLSLRFILAGGYAFFVLLLLYKIIPLSGLSLKQALPGTVFSSGAWLVSSTVFAYYIDNISNYSALYGSIAAYVVLMIWLYLINNIILLGAVINKSCIDQKIYFKIKKTIDK